MICAIAFVLFVSKIKWDAVIGKELSTSEILPALKLTAFLFIFSIAAAYALFIPLSYVVPNYVYWWYLNIPSSIYYDSGTFPASANTLSFILLVGIAPIVEEILFRGLLLRRWIEKWGVARAIILSSIIFSALHADPIGAFAFGVGMCILYLRTQSLYVPIVCHVVNNLVCWLIEAGYFFWYGPDYEYTIEALRGEWYVGFICGLIVLIWAAVFLKSPVHTRNWKLPVV